jgi:hypothetical protein
MARRLSDIISSPLRVMQRIAENAADYLLPDPPADGVEGQPAPVVEGVEKRTAASRVPSGRAQNTSPSSKRVKLEAPREQPFRSKRHKSGYYNEAHLTALAWRGTGSAQDPIRFE